MEVVMAENTTASQTAEKKSTVTIEDDTYDVRPCTNYTKQHEAHVWFSHVKKADCYCDGEKLSATEYQNATGLGGTGTAWTPKKKNDYITSTRVDGRPWREDYTVPMTVTDARAIAFHMHKDDKDKGGEPYHMHLAAVEAGVKVLSGPDATEERIAALFHDAVEDHHTTYEHLRALGCTEDTITMIEAVSKRSSEEQNKYLARIIEAGPGAMRVKAADLMHNLRHDRIKVLADDPKTKYTAKRLLKKYRPALARLLMELSLIVDEDEQKKIATKPVGSATGTYVGAGTSTKPTTFSVSARSLILGDWPTLWVAPIAAVVHGDGSSLVTLANGEIRTEAWRTEDGKYDRKFTVYAYNAWSVSSTVTPNKAATEEAIADYIEIIEKAKEFKKNPSTTTPTYAETGEDDLTGLWDDLAGGWNAL